MYSKFIIGQEIHAAESVIFRDNTFVDRMHSKNMKKENLLVQQLEEMEPLEKI